MRPGAWAQRAAHLAAVHGEHGPRPDEMRVMELVAELRQHRRVLANIGGNLNDVARAVNATGEIQNPAAAQAVLRLVRNVVTASDELLVRIRAELLA